MFTKQIELLSGRGGVEAVEASGAKALRCGTALGACLRESSGNCPVLPNNFFFFFFSLFK